MVIYVPKIGEEINVSLFDEAESTTNNSEGKVNINSANKDQLSNDPWYWSIESRCHYRISGAKGRI